MRDLFFVAVEHHSRLFAGEKSGSNDPFALLAPARMIDVRVHIREKSIFVRRHFVPKRLRLFGDKLNFHQRFRAFESVLPRHNQPDRRAILIAQRLTVKTGGDKRELVARFFNR